MGNRLTLILGGARSGKSDFAAELARTRGGDQVLFVATAEARDNEMRERIAVHRSARPAAWETLQAPRRVGQALWSAAHVRCVLLDCVTLWVSNVLLADGDTATATMTLELNDLLDWYRDSPSELIVVTNEVGMGLVPDTALGRAYRDLLGAVNKRLAAVADHVFFVVAGLPLQVKSPAADEENL